jgi:hypothetical protein
MLKKNWNICKKKKKLKKKMEYLSEKNNTKKNENICHRKK